MKPASVSKAQFLELHAEPMSLRPGNTGFQDEQRVFSIREVQEQRQVHSEPYGLVSGNTESTPGQVHNASVSYEDILSVHP